MECRDRVAGPVWVADMAVWVGTVDGGPILGGVRELLLLRTLEDVHLGV